MQLERAKLAKAIDRIDDHLHAIGALKGRDPREPGRLVKQRNETRLAAIVARHFRKQKQAIDHMLAIMPPAKATKSVYDPYYEALTDDEFGPNVNRLILEFVKDGIQLFADTASIAMDYTLTNIEAAKWARKYTYDLVKGIDDTTRKALQDAISGFIDTPGTTIGDVMDALPFDETRSQLVATTEVTRSYAMAQNLAGYQMKQDFPDVKVVKIWYTNNDDKVCPICGPLEGAEVELGDTFDGGYNIPGDTHPGCRCWIDTRTRING